MKALVFRYSLGRAAYATVFGKASPRAYFGRFGPLKMEEVPAPVLHGEDWALVRTRVCGLCGSDLKQAFLNGNVDNPLTALITFPQTLGHEAVGVVEQVGPAVRRLAVGQRVALNPWLSCGPRGIDPPCDACQRGEYNLCDHFTDGGLPPGMHIGNNKAVPGGFGPYFAAHESQLFPLPEGVTEEQAALSDPFSVSLHAVLKAPPDGSRPVVVYGCGTLGLLTIAVLRAGFPQAEIIAVARYPHQEALAQKLGAGCVIRTLEPLEVIEKVAQVVGTRLHHPWHGKPMLMRGVAAVYDTIGSPETLEVGLRVAQPHARIVISGVANPARFEWTPHYFKEIELVGSNAFGVEAFNGQRRHAFEIYLDLVANHGLDLSALITHRFRLEQYTEAFLTAHNKMDNRAVKVLFDYR